MFKHRRVGWLFGVLLLWASPVALSDQSDKSEEKSAPPTAPAEIKPADEAPADGNSDDLQPSPGQLPEVGSDADEPAAKPGAGRDAKADARRATDEYYELYKSLADALDQVERNYVQPIDRRELMEAAIRGMLEKLDPYSAYIAPEDMSRFRTSVDSLFGGIGIQITVDEGQLKVSSPLVGTPAYRAGVQAGDRIVSIAGKPTRELSLDEAVRRLKGEVGTTVTLTVLHALSHKLETFTLRREIIHVDTVLGDARKTDDSWEFMLDPEKHIGYIRITAFSRDTARHVRKALEELQGRKLHGLILDLRFNPGGLLTSAVEVSDLFVGEGRIVSTKGRNTPQRTWDAVKPGTFAGFPIVVLVNRFSASASEIVAACLQDHERAVVIGERTWGKGSVQNVVELESGKSALKLTTATYARPNGQNIHRFPDAKESDQWGVKPNEGLEVRLTNVELAAFLADRRRRDIVQAHEKTDPNAVAALTPDADGGSPADGTADQDSPVESSKPDVPAEPGDQPKVPDDSNMKSPADATEEDGPPAEKPEVAPENEAQPHEPSAAPSDAEPKSADSKPGEPDETKTTDAEGPAKFVDRQLQKALEYLIAELAAAP